MSINKYIVKLKWLFISIFKYFPSLIIYRRLLIQIITMAQASNIHILLHNGSEAAAPQNPFFFLLSLIHNLLFFRIREKGTFFNIKGFSFCVFAFANLLIKKGLF